jgi:hypothetical protein
MMRKFEMTAVVAFAVVMFAGAQQARAQEVETATVPFPFMVGNVMLPPGHYTVTTDDMDPGLLQIESRDGRYSAFAVVTTEDTTSRRGEAQFKFVNVGGKYYLSRIDRGEGDVEDLAVPTRPVAYGVHAVSKAPAPKK